MFSALKLIDRSKCSFDVPDFQSKDDEVAWGRSLTCGQRLELIWLMKVARYGEEAMSRPMDRRHMEVMTMDEFRAVKELEDAETQAWLVDAERQFLAQQTSDSGLDHARST